MGDRKFLETGTVLPRSEHSISRKNIAQPALKVLYRLRSKGFMAFLVGGALRDMLRDRTPRDFDVVTDADIRQIRSIFRNSRTIGKRFTIVHTYFGSDVIEISSLKTEELLSKNDAILADAKERDFTINALYYDIESFDLHDPLGAMSDLEAKKLVPIGNAGDRFKEDPVRMLRAVKLAVKHEFSPDQSIIDAIAENRECMSELGAGRRYEELTRLFLDENADALFKKATEFGLTRYMWPAGNMMVEEKKPEWFKTVRESLPIHYSRGSYSKSTHLALWLRLFLESGVFHPNLNVDEIRGKFDRFIDPLGMPFRAPVIEALHQICELHHADTHHPKHVELSNESKALLTYYVTHLEPDLEPILEQWMSGMKPSKKAAAGKAGSRRRRGRGRGRRRRGGPPKTAK